MTTDNTQMIDCYEVVPGLGIQRVSVSRRVWFKSDSHWKRLDFARGYVSQKPRVAPRTAVAVPVAEVGNPISEAVGHYRYHNTIGRVISRVVDSKKAGGAA